MKRLFTFLYVVGLFPLWLASPFLAAMPPSSVSVQRSCAQFLDEVIAQATPDSLALGHNKAPEQSVRVVEPRPGRYEGGGRFLVELTGTGWASSYHEFPEAPQGDPRWFIVAAGPKAGAICGFETLGSTQALIPSAPEINEGFRRLSEHLPENQKIKLRFYATSSEKPQIQPTDYLRAFTEFRLPMAAAGVTQIHDVSFHAGTIFFENSIVEHVAAQVRHALQFSDYLKEISKGYPEQDKLKQFLKILKGDYARQVDSGSGNLSLYLAYTAVSNETRVQYAFEDGYLNFTANGMSPEKLLARRVSSSLERIAWSSTSPSPFLLNTSSSFEDWITEHLKKYVQLHAEDEVFKRGLSFNHKTFCKSVEDRRNAIRTAAEAVK